LVLRDCFAAKERRGKRVKGKKKGRKRERKGGKK